MAMTMDQKLDFVHKQTKIALEHVQHFDSGGTVLQGPGTAGTANAVNAGNQGIAGAVGSVLGTNNNFQASGAPITPGTNTGQLNQAYNGAQGALGQVNQLGATVNPGVAQGANAQSVLSGQLMNEANGGGPNPAQMALNQNTAQNIQQQAAIQASQRGAAGNAGLLAQNAAMQGSQIQQQAVGQEATQAAQQQLNAQGAAANLSAQQIGQGENATQLANQTQQNEQNILQGANTAGNNASVSMQGNINSTNAAVAAGNQNTNQNVLSGIGNAISSIGGAVGLFAGGGKVPELPKHLHAMAQIYHPHYAGGGQVWQNSQPVQSQIMPMPGPVMPQYTGSFGKGGSGGGAPSSSKPSDMSSVQAPGDINSSQMPSAENNFGTAGPFSGNNSSLLPSEGDQIALAAGAPGMMANGGKVGSKLKAGGSVPGKPKVNKDAYKNDTVSAKLSPGEVVIDLDTLKDKGKLGQMARFVAQNIERKKMGRKA